MHNDHEVNGTGERLRVCARGITQLLSITKTLEDRHHEEADGQILDEFGTGQTWFTLSENPTAVEQPLNLNGPSGHPVLVGVEVGRQRHLDELVLGLDRAFEESAVVSG